MIFRWIIYWFTYTSTSLNGNSGGVVLVTQDSVYTYIPPYQYASFKVDYFKGDKPSNFTLLASNKYCKLSMVGTNTKIYQTIRIDTIDYKNNITFNVKYSKIE